MIRVDGFDVFTIETPNEAYPSLKKLAGPPIQFRRLGPPLVEKAPAIVKGEPPRGIGHLCRLLVVERGLGSAERLRAASVR